MTKGLLHVYCGTGKGKTTACAGLALRMAGSGGRVLYSFMQKGVKSSEVKSLISNGTLSTGHAKALLSIEGKKNQIEAARRIVKRGLSVREAELLSKRSSSPGKGNIKKDPQITSLEEKLIRSLGTKVRIMHRGKKGKIEIEFYSFEELERLLEILL